MSRDASPVHTSVFKGRPEPSTDVAAEDYPAREYIGGMARELARMADGAGDDLLAMLLDSAARRANEPLPVVVSSIERTVRSA